MKQVILIAGGSRGIGGFLVKSLRDKALLSVCSRNIVEKETNDFLSVKCDVSVQQGVPWFVNETVKKYGRIDVAIFNAGIMIYDRFMNMKEDDLDLMYSVMVKGFLYVCQSVIPVMRKEKSGYIINISSTRGITSAPEKAGYSAMKRAVVSLADSVRLENKEYGIKVTSIHPGLVNTGSTKEKYKDTPNWNPYRIAIEENDIVKAVLFLLSLSKNAYVDSIVIGGKL